MATGTAGTVDTTFTVTAWGNAAGGIWPHMTIRLDGKEIGQASIASTAAGRYSFTAPVTAGAGHTLDVVYDNDGTAGGADRNLSVRSVEVNGQTIAATAASYDRGALDGADVIAGQEGLWWDGALRFSLPATAFPAPVSSAPAVPTPVSTTPTAEAKAASTIVVTASGSAAGGVWPHFTVLVDGKPVGEGTASSSSLKSFSFKADLTADQAHKVQIRYDNDGTAGGKDRNLTVDAITVNGHAVDPTGALVSYDRYGLDGKDVVAGQKGMWWDGTLVVDAPRNWFPPATPPAPPAGGDTTTVVVTARSDLAAGKGAHYTLLVDGKAVGEATVASTAWSTQSFAVKVAPDQAHKVQVRFDNDLYANGEDRNLHVSQIAVNGKAVAATGPLASFDRGALDGKDTMAGRTDLKWDGTLQFNLTKDYFASGSTTPTPPAKPTVAVSDAAVHEPGMIAGGGIAPGPLHTEGNQIVDSTGHNVRLTGVNWFGGAGYDYAPGGLWARNYKDMMDQMKDVGFNVIRLDFSDDTFANGRIAKGIDGNLNPDLVGKTTLEVYDKIIDYAGTIGMKVILDHHRNEGGAGANENGLWYTDRVSEADMIDTWKMLAQHYKGNDTVVGADLHNEPHGPATWGDGNPKTDWAAAAERIGNAIQTVNKDWLMFVEGVERYPSGGTWDWWGGNLRGAKTHDVEFTVPNKLVYSVHSYGPSLANWDWFKAADYPNNLYKLYTDSWGHELTGNEAPILIGEFGGFLTSEADKLYMRELTQYMNGDFNNDGVRDLAAGQQGVSWTYWAWNPNSGDTGGILKDDWKTIDQNKLDQIKGALYQGGVAVPDHATATFTVSLSKPATETVSVSYKTMDGTAKAGSDYLAASGTLTFAAGETAKAVHVTVLGDAVTEGTETFGLVLGSPAGATIADGTGVAGVFEDMTLATADAMHMLGALDGTLFAHTV